MHSWCFSLCVPVVGTTPVRHFPGVRAHNLVTAAQAAPHSRIRRVEVSRCNSGHEDSAGTRSPVTHMACS